jgi:hypothetical protein
MKFQRLPIPVRVLFGIVAIFTLGGAVAIAIDFENRYDLPFLIGAVMFSVVFGYGAVAGRFPDVENQPNCERNNVT